MTELLLNSQSAPKVALTTEQLLAKAAADLAKAAALLSKQKDEASEYTGGGTQLLTE